MRVAGRSAVRGRLVLPALAGLADVPFVAEAGEDAVLAEREPAAALLTGGWEGGSAAGADTTARALRCPSVDCVG